LNYLRFRKYDEEIVYQYSKGFRAPCQAKKPILFFY